MIPADKIFWQTKPINTLTREEAISALTELFNAYHRMMMATTTGPLPTVKDFLQQLGDHK